MRTLILILTTFCLLPGWGGLQAREGAVSTLPRLELLDGTVVAGDLERQKLGYFLHLPAGGRLFRWAEIDPASLPAKVREIVRQRAFELMARGNERYDAGQPLAAQPFFEKVHHLRGYLHQEDADHPLFENISYKLRAWVQIDGEWVSYRAYQHRQGKVYYAGRWMDRAAAEELKAFRLAYAQSKDADSEAAASWPIERVLAEYPDSKYAAPARHLKERLVREIRERRQRIADRREAAERGWDRREDFSDDFRYGDRYRYRYGLGVSFSTSFIDSRYTTCAPGGGSVIVIQR